MPVDTLHPEYQKHLGRWSVTRSVIDSDAKKFIDDVDPNDPARNIKYREDSLLTNFTARTKNALVGSVYRKSPEVELPTSIEYLIDDATGLNLSLDQFSQEIVGDILEVGRYGVLVDYPTAEEGLTSQQVAALDLKARLYGYQAESIINWYVGQINGQCFLDMVVLREVIANRSEDGFDVEHLDQYRVLRMVDGVYQQHIYDHKLELVSVFEPRKADGTNWNYIPFVFIGSEDNDAGIDNSPLYDLATLNIGHLKNSADYEESVHVTGQPTLFLSSNYSVEEFQAANPDGIKIGARAGHNLGEGGNATMLQAAPNQLADEAMRRKEEQAVMIGARLVTPQRGVETAEAARIRYSSENSVLSSVVENVSEGMNKALGYAQEFMSTKDEDIKYALNTQFYASHLDPQSIMAQIQLFDRGAIAMKDLRSNVRKAGFIESDRTDDDIDEDTDVINPLEGEDV